jgi:hypothetical protein
MRSAEKPPLDLLRFRRRSDLVAAHAGPQFVEQRLRERDSAAMALSV